MAKIPRPSRPNAAPNYEEYPIFLYFLNKKIEIRNKKKGILGILGRWGGWGGVFFRFILKTLELEPFVIFEKYTVEFKTAKSHAPDAPKYLPFTPH